MRTYYGVAKPKHDFSNTMIPISGWHSAAMRKMANRIQNAHLNPEAGGGYGGGTASTGRETEHHITVKYGIAHNKPPAHLLKAIANFGPVKAKFGKTSRSQTMTDMCSRSKIESSICIG